MVMTSYLTQYLDPNMLEETVKMAKGTILSRTKFHDTDFDTIAVTGVSGILIGSPLSIALKKNLIIIRKDTSSTHSNVLVEGWGVNQKIVLVDDMIATGETIRKMEEEIGAHCDSPTIVGTYLYSLDNYTPAQVKKDSLVRRVMQNVWG